MGKDAKDDKGLSRRDLLTFWRRPLKELSETPTGPAPSAPAAPTATATLRPPPLRPPGMMHELMLVNLCTHCGKCVEACPAHAIFPLDASWARAAGTPAIDARKQPCVLCDGLQCTHVCPSDALQKEYAPGDVAMGTARLDPTRCLAHRGQPCDVCEKACPRPGAIVIGEGGRVRVEESLCVGCGVCEHVCPTEPTSIRVIPRD